MNYIRKVSIDFSWNKIDNLQLLQKRNGNFYYKINVMCEFIKIVPATKQTDTNRIFLVLLKILIIAI